MSASERKATLERARAAGIAAGRLGQPDTCNPYQSAASRDAWWAGWSSVKPDVPRESRRARTLKSFSSRTALVANQRTPWNKIAAEEARIAEDEAARKAARENAA